jgi:hypothetical protein
MRKKEGDMFQHPGNLQAMVDWKLEGHRRDAEDNRLAHLARPRCRYDRGPRRSWMAWVTRPRRTRSAPKPTIA